MSDQKFMQIAIELALKAEKNGNLPVGALITLDGKVVSEGPSRVYKPRYDLTRHAEMEALRNLAPELWKQKKDLVLFTTLAPCPMCLGAILLFGIPRVVYGAEGDFGGGKALSNHLPPFFKEQFQRVEWVGPTNTADCDPLYKRLIEIEQQQAG